MGKEIKKLENNVVGNVLGGTQVAEVVEYDIPCVSCGKTFTITDSFGLPPSTIMVRNSLCSDCIEKTKK